MQDDVLKIITNKFDNGISCVFVTGKAGTGKSTLLKGIVGNWEKNYIVLAPTGVAALNVGGETIHSFFRIRPGLLPSDAVAEANKQNKGPRAGLYKALEYLIIDEVSMVRADLMDTIDTFLKTIRKDNSAFGGVKVILFGDMFQLPPVVTKDDQEIIKHYYESEYFFSSFVITGMVENIFPQFAILELDKVYRQNDEDFVSVLNKIRNGKVKQHELDILNKRFIEDDIPPNMINLVTTNYKAENINIYHLTQLEENPRTFYAQVTGDFDEKFYPSPAELRIKIGARVMFINNDKDDRWVNGTTGTVIGFGGKTKIIVDGWDDLEFEAHRTALESESKEIDGIRVLIDESETEVFVEPHTWEISKTTFDSSTCSLKKDLVGTYTQLPIIYAWAITIHKSQGKTFDDVIIDLQTGSFAHGQTYVALSRCRTLGGIRLLSKVKPRDIIVDERIVAFFERYEGLIEKY